MNVFTDDNYSVTRFVTIASFMPFFGCCSCRCFFTIIFRFIIFRLFTFFGWLTILRCITFILYFIFRFLFLITCTSFSFIHWRNNFFIWCRAGCFGSFFLFAVQFIYRFFAKFINFVVNQSSQNFFTFTEWIDSKSSRDTFHYSIVTSCFYLFNFHCCCHFHLPPNFLFSPLCLP
ncbi:hypothetical protein D3C71_1276950 [compost metagenome]